MRKISIRFILLMICFLGMLNLRAQENIRLKKKDRKRDVELVTTEGSIILRLYDSTPLHRDNFLRLVKSHFYDSLLFHRVIRNFMIQSGDPNSRRAVSGVALGNGGPAYKIPAEFRSTIFHKKGVLAAAREGDQVNPEKQSSGSQFYIVSGRTFSDHEMDSIEVVRLKGYKFPLPHREIYRTVGGTPQLDQNYTAFGEVVKGQDIVERIARTATSKGPDRDRPFEDVRILKARLVKRRN